MPTYGYVCDECGHEFEVFHSITAEPQLECPNCDGKQVRKLLTGGSGLIFKGSGFYITDYKKAKSEKKSAPKKTEKKQTSD